MIPGEDPVACRYELTLAVVEIQTVLVALVSGFFFNPPARYVEIKIPVAVGIEEEGSHVLSLGIGKEGRGLTP